LLTACGQPGFENVGQDTQALLYGQPSGPADDGVMMIWATTSTQIQKCTASLVAPNLVVTALHCVAAFDDSAPFTCDSSGNLVSTGNGGEIGATVDPSTLSVRTGTGPTLTLAAKGTQIFAADTTSICRNDLALVLLDRTIDAPLVPMRLLTGTEPGEAVRMVGYGIDEEGGFGVRRVRDDLVVAQVGSSVFRPNGDPIPPRTIVTDGPSGCSGDSGGPLFSKYKALIGSYSSVSTACTAPDARDYFTEIAPFYNDVVMPAFAAANAQPLFENMTDAAGAAGAAGAGGEGNSAGTDSGGSAGDTTTTVGGGDTAGSAPTGTAGGTAYTGLRKPGGCTCRAAVPSSDASFEPLLALPLLMLLRRRRRAARQR
jgi:hypothetical protein